MKIGDVVKCVKSYDGNDLIVGKYGIIVDDDGNWGVRFTSNIEGHDLDGNCKDNFGWYIPKTGGYLKKSSKVIKIKEKISPKIPVGSFTAKNFSKKGFYVGCTFVSWKIYDEIGKLKPKN